MDHCQASAAICKPSESCARCLSVSSTKKERSGRIPKEPGVIRFLLPCLITTSSKVPLKGSQETRFPFASSAVKESRQHTTAGVFDFECWRVFLTLQMKQRVSTRSAHESTRPRSAHVTLPWDLVIECSWFMNLAG